jgi:hypothetical protein
VIRTGVHHLGEVLHDRSGEPRLVAWSGIEVQVELQVRHASTVPA